MRDFHTAYQEAKSLPSSALHDEMRNGSGNIPEFIVMAELDSRAAMQGGGKRPKITVRDEMMMGLPPPQMKPQVPTNGFSDGGLTSYYNWAIPDLLNDEFGEPHKAGDVISSSMRLLESNQPPLEAPFALQSLTDESGKTPLQMPGLPDTLKEPLAFAEGGVVGGMTPEERAFLSTLYGPESAGKYNARYPSKTFSGYEKHPNIPEVIMHGPNKGKTSTAAGAPQFLYSEWIRLKEKLNLSDFSPKNQDIAAIELARERYRMQTGGSLQKALASGNSRNIAGVGNALRGTWTSLPGGIEQGTTEDEFVSAYNNSLNNATGLSLSRTPQETTTGTEMVNLTSEPEDTGLATILAQMAETRKETPLPKRDLRMTYADDDRRGLEELIALYGGNI